MNESKPDAHDESMNNRIAIETEPIASCFACFRSYPTELISKWIDNEATAVCPYCSVDSVIPGKVELDVLNSLHKRWFSPDALEE